MTQQQPLTRGSTLPLRRVGWFVVACAAVSFALSVAARLQGGAIRWTGWVLPVLITANAAVFFLGALDRRPRLVRPFIVLSMALAGAVIVAETLILFHR